MGYSNRRTVLDIRNRIKVILEQHGVSEPETIDNILLVFFQTFSGQMIYIPKQFEKSYRNEQIRQEFTGANIPSLAQKYKLSSRRIREILLDK